MTGAQESTYVTAGVDPMVRSLSLVPSVERDFGLGIRDWVREKFNRRGAFFDRGTGPKNGKNRS